MTSETTKSPARHRVPLAGISSRAWEHPADRGALTALRELRGFDQVVKALNAVWNERAYRLMYLGGAVRVDHRQYSRVYRLFAEAGAVLDVPELPELYVRFDRTLNGACVGMAQPFIVINTGAVELLDDEELRVLLGHELGHLRSGHAVYRTIMLWLLEAGQTLAFVPGGTIALRVIMSAMYEWWRKAELSADRAGLLAGQDPAASLRLAMKLAGGGDLTQIDTTAFLEQAAEFERSGDLRDSLLRMMLVARSTHPMPVARAAELRQWVDSGAYPRILAGHYPRRSDDASAPVGDDVKAAADHYREAFRDSQDPLVNLLRKIGDGASGIGERVGGARAWPWSSSAGRGGAPDNGS
ncbi:MAG TPA: M48 family metallopeptidase [Micromonosporaceae bacterium]